VWKVGKGIGEKMNLLVLAPHYDTFIKGPIEELAKYFDKIHIIIPKFKEINLLGKKIKIFGRVDQPFTTNRKNVNIYEINVSPFLPFSAKKITSFIRNSRINFDIVLAHFIVPYGYLGNKTAKKFKKKLIIVGHGFDVYDLPFRNIIFNMIIRSILKDADKIITVSNKNYNILTQLSFSEKVVVIPNGFDSKKFKPLNQKETRKKLHLPSNKKIILNVAHLVPIKNQKNLILAFRELSENRDDVLLYIVGGGVLEKELKELVKKLHLENKVFLVGPKPHEEIPLWMNAADVFVLPSYSEGNPTVMFEALGCGLPFIGTKVGGIPEIITSEDYGFLLDDPNNYKRLAELIDKALNKKWNKQKILKYAQLFTWQRIAKAYLKVFREVEKC